MKRLIFRLQPIPATRSGDVYGRLAGPVWLKDLPPRMEQGSLVVVRPDGDTPLKDVADTTYAVTARVRNAALALCVDRIDPHRALLLTRHVGACGIGAVVDNLEPTTGALREQLSDPNDWPRRVLMWTRNRGVNLKSECAWLLEAFARDAAGHKNLREFAFVHGIGESLCTRRFRWAQLGSATRWYQALRLTRVAIEVQRDLESVEQVAFRFGFSSRSALSDRLVHVTGARPRDIRQRLGWEWILSAALWRLGLRIRSPQKEGSGHETV